MLWVDDILSTVRQEDPMKPSLKFSAAAAATWIVFASACAQVPAPPPPMGPAAAAPPPAPGFPPAPGMYDPNQLPETRGTV